MPALNLVNANLPHAVRRETNEKPHTNLPSRKTLHKAETAKLIDMKIQTHTKKQLMYQSE